MTAEPEKPAINAEFGASSEAMPDFIHSDDISVSEPEDVSEAAYEPVEEELSAPIMSDGLSSTEEKTQIPAPTQKAQSLKPSTTSAEPHMGDVRVVKWAIHYKELKKKEITRDEYFEWKINWPFTYDDGGRFEPSIKWRKARNKSKFSYEILHLYSNCTQKAKNNLGNLCYQGFRGFICLFPLNRSRRFCCNIIKNPVYILHLIYNP